MALELKEDRVAALEMSMKDVFEKMSLEQLLAVAKDLHEKAYRRASWNQDRYKDKTGFFLRAMVSPSVWTLKDCDHAQLQHVIAICTERLARKGVRKQFLPPEIHD